MNSGIRIAALVAALLLAAGVGFWAYQAGVAHGIEQSSKIVVAAPGAGPYPYPAPYPYYGWHHPWGGGFFFGPLLGFLFVLILLRVLVRGLFWRGVVWHSHGAPGCYPGYAGRYGPRGRFEEWHRQAHARDGEAPPPAGGEAPR
jgi:hypothetical protein